MSARPYLFSGTDVSTHNCAWVPRHFGYNFRALRPGSIWADNAQETDLLRQSCQKVLCASAVVSSTISHHVLNVLRRELSHVHPLLWVLPNYQRVGSRSTPCGAILPEHWTRFRLYADRVRVIHGLQGHLEDTIEPSIWLFLAAKCKGSPLMPRLREIYAHNVPIPEVSALTLLISPTLRIVDLSFLLEDEEDTDIAPRVVGSLLHTLPLMAPDLEHFSYDVDFSFAREPVNMGYEHLESFGLQFSRLKTLSIRCAVLLDKDILQSLSGISTLQDLRCTSIILPSSSALALPQSAFPQLTHLHLGGHFDHLVPFFQACQLPRLTSLLLQITGYSSVRDTRNSLVAICRCFDPMLLTSFSFDVYHASTPDRDSPRPNSLMQIFEPLLAFPNVTSFQFYSFYVVPPVQDADIARFGAAWPRLASFRVLHLAGQYSVPTVARPTLPGLIDFAQRCPRLKVLHIPELDATVIPAKGAVPLVEHRLRHFTMMNIMSTLPPKACMEVAAVLDRVFPALDLECAWLMGAPSGIWREWKEIVRFLEAMRLGRENGGPRAELRDGSPSRSN